MAVLLSSLPSRAACRGMPSSRPPGVAERRGEGPARGEAGSAILNWGRVAHWMLAGVVCRIKGEEWLRSCPGGRLAPHTAAPAYWEENGGAGPQRGWLRHLELGQMSRHRQHVIGCKRKGAGPSARNVGRAPDWTLQVIETVYR